jgi:ABC-type bacteriocin/lantibiotic exporter with double-glycine peptidase domain
MAGLCLFSLAAVAAGQDEGPGVPAIWRNTESAAANALFLQLRGCGHDILYGDVVRAVAEQGYPVTLARLENAATALGAASHTGFGSMDALTKTQLPVIVHLEDAVGDDGRAGGYAIVVRMDPNSVTLFDAATVLRQSIGRQAFQRLWSGHVLIASPPSRLTVAWLVHWGSLGGAIVLLLLRWRLGGRT